MKQKYYYDISSFPCETQNCASANKSNTLLATCHYSDDFYIDELPIFLLIEKVEGALFHFRKICNHYCKHFFFHIKYQNTHGGLLLCLAKLYIEL